MPMCRLYDPFIIGNILFRSLVARAHILLMWDRKEGRKGVGFSAHAISCLQSFICNTA